MGQPEAEDHLVGYDEWLARKVGDSITAAGRGEIVPDEDVRAWLQRKKRGAMARRPPASMSLAYLFRVPLISFALHFARRRIALRNGQAHIAACTRRFARLRKVQSF